MSYDQTVKWGRRHRKGTNQPLLMSTQSGFWPSYGFLSSSYWPYVAECEAAGIEPIPCEEYYRATLNGQSLSPQDS